MIKMPIDRTRAERGVVNRSSDYFISDFVAVCVTLAFLVSSVSLVVWS